MTNETLATPKRGGGEIVPASRHTRRRLLALLALLAHFLRERMRDGRSNHHPHRFRWCELLCHPNVFFNVATDTCGQLKLSFPRSD